MEHSAPQTKRPRLSTPASWSSKLHGQGLSLPQPNPPHHPSVSGGPHHPLPPAQYTPAPPFSRPPEPPLPPAPHHQPLDERRHHHHEHEHYPPMQDTPRQLPPSPAHPSYPPYSQRDTIVKRDIGEEPALPQLRRPSSTGHTVDGLPPTPHGPPHPNQHHPSEDPRRHMNFDNGGSMPHSPALYRPPALPQTYHPSTSQQPPQHYDGPHNYGHPPQMYAALEIQNASAKRKPQRASQACDNCRQLKAKCDETKPYILEILNFLKEEMSSMSAKFDKFDKIESRISNLESMAMHGNPEAAKMKMESIEEDDQPNLRESSISDNRDMPDAEEEATETSTPGRTSVLEPPLSLNEAQETLRQGDHDDVETEPGPMVLPGRPAMPPNHTTLASLLLKWPSINKLVHHILDDQKIRLVEEYPIQEEQQRGVLRVFGRGEGPNSDTRSSDKGTPQDLSITDGEDASDVIAPTPGPELWGQVGSPVVGHNVNYKDGVLTADGNPDWDQNRILKYVKSFKDNILNMHPILIPKELDAMVRVFLEQLPKSANTPSSNKANSYPVGFIHPPPAVPEVGNKRKRSPIGEELSPVTSFKKPGRPYRNIQSALVLLVFALGKICLHKGKIPDVVHEPEGFTGNSPLVRNGVLASPSQGSPGLVPPSSSGLPSPKENERAILMSRRSSLQGNSVPFGRASSSHRRNLDVIPGLEYFALACDIMGADYGGFCLKHVYVHILAGLYHGQLGRVLESWEHISTASRKLQVVLRPSLGRLSQLGRCSPHARRDNQLAFAFWTCLQLESDILAELPLPQSGILAYESQMPYPNTEFAHAHGFPPYVTEGYLAQLYLRKQLNRVHNLLYDPTTMDSRHYQTMESKINEIQSVLKSARNTWVPSDYSWQDDDPLPDDILAARLRAKYWGSQVILYRPFLRMILDGEAQPPSTYQNEHASPDTITSIGIDERSRKGHDPRTIGNARLAIDALIESTRAFHGIHKDKRIIITNVFGTAHAQWGNLLTLAACYNNETLAPYINVDTLSGLFSRTIAFFKEIAQPSSALHKDLNILISLAAELGFPQEDMDIRGDSSFSSATSSAPLPPIYPPNNFYRAPSSPSLMRQH
ncbi:hypothetical protein GQX73_g5190 [Xylaria multiplex]|uniref:Transcription factor domain-containing protein n=1 Tax=Xylaria multiplex TaxID=323545 RepID=A0A7C8IS32_9PEZI|nr:hypothetical protein GQX73_g5190 [Xylaria multiplex]